MRKLFMTTIAATGLMAGVAFAEETTATITAPQLGGSINVEVTENAAGDYVATTTLGVGMNAANGLAFGGATVESVDGSTFELDEWQIGTSALGMVTLTFGKQGDIFVGNDFEIVGGTTLAEPADDHESLIADFGSAAVMVGLTDIKTDITDVENIQGSYSFGDAVAVTAVADYNLDSEEWMVGSKLGMSLTDDVAVGGLVTYSSATEVFGYEASANYSMVTAFINGDDTDAFQNVGAGVSHNLGGLDVYAEGSYNIDAEDTTVGAGITFSF